MPPVEHSHRREWGGSKMSSAIVANGASLGNPGVVPFDNIGVQGTTESTGLVLSANTTLTHRSAGKATTYLASVVWQKNESLTTETRRH